MKKVKKLELHDSLANEIDSKINSGSSNAEIALIKTLIQQIDTRTYSLTYSNGILVKVEEKDGTTVIKTTNLAYLNGKLDSATEIVGGKSITTKLIYDGNGNLTGTTRSVV